MLKHGTSETPEAGREEAHGTSIADGLQLASQEQDASREGFGGGLMMHVGLEGWV